MPESSTNKQLNESHRWQGLSSEGGEGEAKTHANGHNTGQGKGSLTGWKGS